VQYCSGPFELLRLLFLLPFQRCRVVIYYPFNVIWPASALFNTAHHTAIFDNSTENKASIFVASLAVVMVGDRVVRCLTLCPWLSTLSGFVTRLCASNRGDL
jgi:hypothetical protein